MEFNYLGETYTVSQQIYNSCKDRNLTRRLFSLAKLTTPTTDTKLCHFWIYSYYQVDLEFTSCFSANPRYIRKFKHLDPAKHFHYYPLSKKQCEYLHEKISLATDFREAVAIAKEEIKVFK